MTTKQMEYIIELSKTQNFNKAAERLFITQPALTYQIRRAEEEIGFDIFIRTGKGAGLTAAGERLVETLVGILDDYHGAVEEARRLSPGFAAAIRLALPERVAVVGLAEALEAFAEENPKAPVIPRRFSVEAFREDELPDADVVLEVKDRRMRRHREWKEYAELNAYIAVDDLPKTQDIVVEGEEEKVWIPYAAEPVSVALLTKNDEKREIIHIFSEKIVQNTQRLGK